MEYVEDDNFRVLRPDRSDDDLRRMREMIESPQDYSGMMVYVVGEKKLTHPFIKSNKFYYNDEGSWYESPFGG